MVVWKKTLFGQYCSMACHITIRPYSITCFLRAVSLGSTHASHSNHGFSRTARETPAERGLTLEDDALVRETILVEHRGITSL
jgi:hypothetical protein